MEKLRAQRPPRGPRTSLLLRLSYDGSRFYGVSPQPGLPTVAAALRARLEAAFPHRPRSLVLAALTDAGVHAVENMATCWLPEALDASDGLQRLAAPREDGLLRVEGRVVPPHVFARTLAGSKHYRYRLEGGHDPAEIAWLRQQDLGCRADPERPRMAPQQGHAWQVALPLEVAPMRVAAAHLVGTHDFSAFKVGPLGARSPVRTLQALRIEERSFQGRSQVVIDVYGTGFLHKMVRILAGTLAEVGAGLRSPSELPALLASRDRQRTGQAALARGLCLVSLGPDPGWFPLPWTEPADWGGRAEDEPLPHAIS